MSKYTMNMEEYSMGKYFYNNPGKTILDYQDLTDAEVIALAKDIFPSSYPFYTDASGVKDEFETQFLSHFWFDEIGQETIARFKWCLKNFLNERMPYFAALYGTVFSNYADALKTTDITESYSEQGTENESKDKHNSASSTTENDRNTEGTTMSDQTSTQQQSSTSTDTKDEVNSVYPFQTTPPNPLVANPTDRNDINQSSSASGSASGVTSNSAVDTGKVHDEGSATSNSTEMENRDLVQGKEYERSRVGTENINPIEQLEKYRSLIISINTEIFNAAKAYGLFMRVY